MALDKLEQMEDQPLASSQDFGQINLRVSRVSRILNDDGGELVINECNQLLHIIQAGTHDEDYTILINSIADCETAAKAAENILEKDGSTLHVSMLKMRDLTNEQYSSIRDAVLGSSESDLELAA